MSAPQKPCAGSEAASEAASEAVSAAVAEIAHWLTSRARLIDDTEKLDQRIIERLRGAGLPIVRYFVAVPSLHPQVDGFGTLWEQGKGLQMHEHLLDEKGWGQLKDSPFYQVFYQGRGSRHRLSGPPAADEYTILGELRDGGMTDYVVLALPFSDGSHKAMTLATDAPQGFDEEQIALLDGLSHALAATIETRYLRHQTGMLMDTYVGPVAGRKVLQGAIKRGSGETIRAVIWFCDIKGYTALSERLSGETLLETLNSYFEVMTEAIESENGEVLKFIGDAILAIFQPGEHGDQPGEHGNQNGGQTGDQNGDQGAAVRALAAARTAIQDLEVVNNQRRGRGQPVIECGIALHLGDLLYGNVGGRRRLDFTVIGPAVNLASRIEALTRNLGQPVLVSAAFAETHGGAFENLGMFGFKGIARRSAVLAPAG